MKKGFIQGEGESVAREEGPGKEGGPGRASTMEREKRVDM